MGSCVVFGFPCKHFVATVLHREILNTAKKHCTNSEVAYKVYYCISMLLQIYYALDTGAVKIKSLKDVGLQSESKDNK